MGRFAALTVSALFFAPAFAAEPAAQKGPPPDFQCRPSSWSPPWNHQHCKEREGMWVNGKCLNARWVIVECKMP
jgi:hypothetical protein